jgi:hypothetical protein
MEIIAIEIIDKKALQQLNEMEQQHLIRFKKNEPQTTAKKNSFAGKLTLTDEQYQNFINHSKNIRNEWEDRI